MSEAGTGTTLQRPYLLRAMHEWMTDNNLTPHIVIDVSAAQSSLPVEYAKDGRLVVPERPAVPFIAGDGIGPEVWRAARSVIDAAVDPEAVGDQIKAALGVFFDSKAYG